MADIKGKFPSQVEKERIKTLKKYTLLYDNEQQSVFDLHEIIKSQYKNVAAIVYIAHAVPSKVSDFYGDFVQGDDSQLTIQMSKDSDATDDETLADIVKGNDLVAKIYDYAVNQSQYGFEILLGSVEDGKFKIHTIGKDQYFPQRDGSVIFATFMKDPADTNPVQSAKRLLLYTQHYAIEGTGVKIERKGWKVDTNGVADEEVNLTEVGVDLPSEETIENLERLPIVQIDNGRKTRWGFGKSDYNDIMPNLQELNERTTHVSTQLLKNMDAILEIPAIEGSKDNDGSFKKIDTIELTDKDTPRSKYVALDNPLINETFTHLDRQVHFISWVTGVPVWELMASGQPERVEGMRIKMFNAIRKTDTKRGKIRRGLQEIIEVGYKMLGKEFTGEIIIDFSDVLPTDPMQEASVEETKVNVGLTSRKSAMKRLESYTNDEADNELEEIRKESIESGAVDPNNAPTI